MKSLISANDLLVFLTGMDGEFWVTEVTSGVRGALYTDRATSTLRHIIPWRGLCIIQKPMFGKQIGKKPIVYYYKYYND